MEKKEFNIENYDRYDFPKDITRVTSGSGGDCLFINGKEKCAVYDCGMAYCHSGLIENIEKALKNNGKDTLDYVFISHTHYDHIGALPYILERWPEAKVCGAAKAQKVFQSEGAKKTMKRLGESARDLYSNLTEEIKVEGMRLDIPMADGDCIDLGGISMTAVETKGHTDCSMSYLMKPCNLLFSSESTGVLRPSGKMDTSILKNFEDTIKSAEKCRKLKPSGIIVNHYGVVPKEMVDTYYDMYIAAAEEEKEFILDLHKKYTDYQRVLEGYRDRYWTEERKKNQPEAAFLENAKYIIRHIIETYA